MVFIAAGMGGGTGTGAAPVIAEVARARGILTVGVVTKPFLFEGTRRMRAAEAGIDELQKYVDTLIVIPNQNLFLVAKADTTFKEAFQLADEVLQQGVRSITDLIVNPGMINLDFADIRSVMNEMGKAMMGTGEGEGENRALEAAERAIANPLLDGVSMQGAKGVIISIIGGDDMRLMEVDEAANHIRELVDPEANIIWGTAFNPDLKGKIRVSVVATGIDTSHDQPQAASRPLDLSSVRGPKMPVAAPSSDRRFGALPAAEVVDDGALDLGALEEMAGSHPADLADYSEVEEPVAPAKTVMPEPADQRAFANLGDGGFAATVPGEESTARDELDLADAEAAPARQDELLLDANRLIDADEPVQARRRRMLDSSTPDQEQAADVPIKKVAPTGSTLFERMAGLSRGSSADEGDGDDDAGAMRIPRFLGRQNNQ